MTTRLTSILQTICAGMFAAVWTASAQQPAYLDTSLLAERRPADLVGRMTLEGKVSQHSPLEHSSLQLVERSVARVGGVGRDGISRTHRAGRHWAGAYNLITSFHCDVTVEAIREFPGT